MTTSPLALFFLIVGLYLVASALLWFRFDRSHPLARWFIPLTLLFALPPFLLLMPTRLGVAEGTVAGFYGPLALLAIPLMLGAVSALSERPVGERVASGFLLLISALTLFSWYTAANGTGQSPNFEAANAIWFRVLRATFIGALLWIVLRPLLQRTAVRRPEALTGLGLMLFFGLLIPLIPSPELDPPGTPLVVMLMTVGTGLLFVWISSSERLFSQLSRLTPRLSLRNKFLVGFTALLAIALVISFISASSLAQLNNKVQGALNTRFQLLALADQVSHRYREARRYERDYGLVARSRGLGSANASSLYEWGRTTQPIPRLLEQVRGVAATTTLPAEGVNEIESNVLTYIEESDRFFRLYQERGDRTSGAIGLWLRSVRSFDSSLGQTTAMPGDFSTALATLRANQLNYLVTQEPTTEAVIEGLYRKLQQGLQSSEWALPATTRREYQRLLDQEVTAFGEVRRLSRLIGEQERLLITTSQTVEGAINAFTDEASRQYDRTQQEILVQQVQAINFIILALMIGAAMVYFLARVIALQVEEPLLALTRASARVAEGEIDTQVPIRSEDELGRLARAFNTMAERVQGAVSQLESRVARRTAQLETAAQVSAAASQQRDLTDLLTAAVQLIVERFADIYHAQIFLVDDSRQWAELRTSTGEAGRELLARHHRLAIGSQSVIGQVTKTGQHLLSRAVDPYGIHRPNPLLPETKSELALPMRFQGEIIGALDVQSRLHYAFQEDEIRALQTMADQLTVAIQNARYLENLGSTLQEIELLFNASFTLSQATSREAVSEALISVAESLQHPDLDRLWILLFNRGMAGELSEFYLNQMWEPERGTHEGIPIPASGELIQALSQGTTGREGRIVPVISTESVGDSFYPFMTRLGVRSMAYLPMRAGDAPVGLVAIQKMQPGAIAEGLVRIFQPLVQQAALIVSRFTLQEALEERLRELEALRQSFLELGGIEEFDALLRQIATSATTLLAGTGAALYLREPEQPSLTLHATYRLDLPLGIEVEPGEGAAGQLLLKAEPIYVADYPNAPFRLEQITPSEAIRSVLAVPLLASGELIGALKVTRGVGAAPFVEDDLRRLTLFADQAALLLRNSQLAEVSSRAAAQLGTAAEVSQAASSQLEIERLLDETVTLIRDKFGYYHTQIFLLDESRQQAVLRAAAGEIGSALLARQHALPVGGRSVIGLTTGTATPTLARSVHVDPETIHRPNPLLPDTRTELALPLRIGDEVIGALDVQSTSPTAFTDEEDITILQTLADQLAVAVQNARLFQRAQSAMDETDQLYRVSRSINEADTVQELALLLQELAAAAPTVDQLLLFRYRPTTDPHHPVTLTRVAYWDREALPPPPAASLLFSAASVVRLREALFGQTHLLQEFSLLQESAPELHRYLDSQHATQMFLAPLRGANLELGVMAVLTRSAATLDERSQRLFSVISSQVGNALGRFHLLDTMQQRVEDLEALRRSFLELNVGQSRESLLASLAERASSLLADRPTALFVGDATAPTVIYHNATEEEQGQWFTPAAPRLLSLRVPEIVTVGDEVTGSIRVLTTPLLSQNESMGAIAVLQITEGLPFDDNDLRRLSLFADQASLAIQNVELVGAHQRAATRMATAATVSDALIGRQAVNTLLSDSITLIQERFGFYHVQAFLLDAELNQAVLTASTGEAGEQLLARRHRLPVGSQSTVGQAAAQGRPVVAVADVEGTIHRRNPLLPQTRAEMALPMLAGGGVYGVLDVQSTEATAFNDPADREVLQTLANQLAAVVENTRLFDQSERSVRENQQLYQTAQAIAAATDIPAILRLLSDQLAPEADLVAFVTVAHRGPGKTVLETIGRVSRANPDGPEEDFLRQIDLAESDFAAALQAREVGEIQLLANTQTTTLPLPLRRFYKERGIHSAAIIPMGRLDSRMWLLHVSRTHLKPFREGELDLLRRIIPQVVVALQNLWLVENLEVRARRLNLANELSNRLLSAPTAAELASVATSNALDILDADHATLTLYDEPSDRAIVISHTTRDGSTIEDEGYFYPLSSSKAAARYRSGTPFIQRDASQEADLAEPIQRAMQKYGQENYLAVPIWLRDRLLGSIAVTRAGSHPDQLWSAGDRSVLQTVATHIAGALENERLLSSLAERAATLGAINESIAEMVAAPTLTELFERAVVSYVEIAGVSQSGIVLIDPESMIGRVVAQHRVGQAAHSVGAEFSVEGNESVEWVRRHRRPLAIDDVASDERLGEGRALLTSQGVKSILLLPLMGRGQLIGSIGLDMFVPHHWSDEEIERAATMSNAISAAIENVRLLEQMDITLRRTEGLYQTSRAINEASSFDDVTRAIALNILGDPGTSVLLISLNLDANQIIHSGHVEGSYVPSSMTSPMQNRDIVMRYLSSARRLNLATEARTVGDVEHDPSLDRLTRRYLRRLGVGAFMSVPLRLPSGWTGIILCIFPTPRALTADDQQRLRVVSTQAATALQNLALLERTNASLRESQLLFQAGAVINEATSYEALLAALQPMVAPFNPDQSVLALFEEPMLRHESLARVTAIATLNRRAPLLPTGYSLRLSDFPLLRRLPLSEPVLFDDVQRSPDVSEEERRQLEALGLRALMYFPLRIAGHYLGWVGFNAREPREIEQGLIAPLQTLMQQVAVAIQRQQLLEEAQRQALQDEHIARITARLYSTIDPEEIMRIGVQELKQTLRLRRALVWTEASEALPTSLDLTARPALSR